MSEASVRIDLPQDAAFRLSALADSAKASRAEVLASLIEHGCDVVAGEREWDSVPVGGTGFIVLAPEIVKRLDAYATATGDTRDHAARAMVLAGLGFRPDVMGWDRFDEWQRKHG